MTKTVSKMKTAFSHLIVKWTRIIETNLASPSQDLYIRWSPWDSSNQSAMPESVKFSKIVQIDLCVKA